MTAARKVPIGPSTSYKLAAALHRAKLAATNTAVELEVRPTGGKIRVVLNGKPIPRELQESTFGPSAIDIPEFGLARKK